MNEFRDLTPDGILYHIVHSKNRLMDDSRVFVVTGKSGPTGKSWLANELNTRGYHTIELSEGIGPLVQYRDDNNHVIVHRDCVLIVLNHRLPRFKECTAWVRNA